MPITVRKPGFRIARSYEVAFSPMGDRLACIAVHVDLWDVESRARIARAHPFKHPSHVDFSPDGTRLAVKSTAGDVVVLNAATLDVVARHDGRRWGEGAQVLFSPDGQHLVDGSWRGALVVRDAVSGDVVHSEEDEGIMVQHLAATPDRRIWVQAIWLHPARGGRVTIRRWPFSQERLDVRGECDAAALNASGSRLAVVGSRRLRVWDVATLVRRPKLIGESDELPISGTGRGVAWSPSGGLLALAGAGVIRLFSADAREVWRIELEYACSVAFSPSGELLACGAWSKGFVIATPSTTLSG